MAPAVDFDSFLAKYVKTNVLPGSVDYDHEFLVKDLLGELIAANEKTFSKLGLPILVCLEAATQDITHRVRAHSHWFRLLYPVR